MAVPWEPNRRELLSVAVGAGVGLMGSAALASSDQLPAKLQAKLLAKVAGYDRSLKKRSGGKVLVLVVRRGDSPVSERMAGRFTRALEQQDDIGGLPFAIAQTEFESASGLAARCREGSISIVYLSDGFGSEVSKLQKELGSIKLLSVTAEPPLVPLGVVLGFRLVAGKPKLLVNLGQARAQGVRFKARLLKIAKVYR